MLATDQTSWPIFTVILHLLGSLLIHKLVKCKSTGSEQKQTKSHYFEWHLLLVTLTFSHTYFQAYLLSVTLTFRHIYFQSHWLSVTYFQLHLLMYTYFHVDLLCIALAFYFSYYNFNYSCKLACAILHR